MKIAVVDHMVNPGGSSRVLLNLLPALKSLRPDWSFTFYCNLQCAKKHGLIEKLSSCVDLVDLRSTRLLHASVWNGRGKSFIPFLQRRFRDYLKGLPLYFSGDVKKELDGYLEEHDLLFCHWPFFLECPDPGKKIPFVTMFYDFNYQYFFNRPYVQAEELQFLHREMQRWMERSIPVVPTRFMQQELNRFCQGASKQSHIIPLSSLASWAPIPKDQAKQIARDLGVSQRYILYPTNLSAHKNITQLLAAFERLKKTQPDLQLVLAGHMTEMVNGELSSLGLRLGSSNGDLIGLGYVTDEQIDALIQCAQLVVSPSLYEAGCGPGLDAWSRGVPVAMSRIPPFTEHLEVQGLRAALFDPYCADDIAEKIDSVLCNIEQARADALYSQQTLSRYGWKEVAEKYIAVFEQAIHDQNSSLPTVALRQ